MTKLITMLAASTVFFVRGAESPVKPADHAVVPDVRRIVEDSIAATRRSWQARLQYTYMKRDEDRRRDAAGRVQSEDIIVSRTVLINGVPFDQLVEHNGKPPSAEEVRKEREKRDRLKRETAEHRAERLRNLEAENALLVEEVPKAFDFQLISEDVVNGRLAYVLQATPHPAYRARGKYGKMLPKLQGRLWIDKRDLAWIKVDGEVMQPLSMGLFLVRVLRGSHITMEQIRIDDGIWMPERVGVRAAAKIFFVKDLIVDRSLSYSEYKWEQVPLTRNP
jgi:hypothetical protein